MVGLVLLMPLFYRSDGIKAGIATQVPALQFLRGVVGSVAMFCGFYAIVHLPLADAQAISFRANLFIVPLAAMILSGVIGLRRSLAAAVGFVGVLIMLRPGSDLMFSIPALTALSHAVLVALATILVSIVSRYDRPGNADVLHKCCRRFADCRADDFCLANTDRTRICVAVADGCAGYGGA